MFDPRIVKIQGDISRNDVIQLVKWCKGKNVCEFGMGGSTLLLARCAKSLRSYDSNKKWYDITAKRISQIPDKTCEPILICNDGHPPSDFVGYDVLWVDGVNNLRPEWIKLANKCKVVIIHDSRRPGDWQRTMHAISSHFLKLKTIHCHIENSNLIIFEMRNTPVAWENWNRTETENRVNCLDYVN